MKLVKNQLIKLIRKSLLKEFKASGENFTITPPTIDIPGLDSGGGFPPAEPPKDRGGGESCDDYGDKYNKAYWFVMDAFNVAYPYMDGNHRVFLQFLNDSGIQLPFTEESASKDLIDYVTDTVLDRVALDVCRMYIPKDENYLVNLFKSPFTLLDGIEQKDGTNTASYLPGAKLRNF